MSPQDGILYSINMKMKANTLFIPDAPEVITDNTLADYAPYAFIRRETFRQGKHTSCLGILIIPVKMPLWMCNFISEKC